VRLTFPIDLRILSAAINGETPQNGSDLRARKNGLALGTGRRCGRGM
jgi:hypothetical protein